MPIEKELEKFWDCNCLNRITEHYCIFMRFKYKNLKFYKLIMNSNFKFGEVNKLADLFATNPTKVNFTNIFETENGGISLLSFDKGQKLEKHVAPFEVMVLTLEGEIEFTMLDNKNIIRTGEFLLMGSNVPHSVKANEQSKVMLIKIKN